MLHASNNMRNADEVKQTKTVTTHGSTDKVHNIEWVYVTYT